jgi:hypothetical protein
MGVSISIFGNWPWFSLTPGFSRMPGPMRTQNGFNRFSAHQAVTTARFACRPATGLKPGVNETAKSQMLTPVPSPANLIAITPQNCQIKIAK